MKETKDTILIRSPNWVGDAVVATAILKPLRSHFADSRIEVVAKQYVAALFEQNPYIDDMRIFRGFSDGIRKITGDIGIILPNSFSSALLFKLSGVKRRIGYRSECRGFLLTDALPLPPLKEEHLVENYGRLALRILESSDCAFEPSLHLSNREAMDPLREGGFALPVTPVIIDPGSAYGPAREWQKEKYADVIDYLGIEKRLPVILLGSEQAKKIADEIFNLAQHKPNQLTGKLTLRQALVLISRSRLYISTDTGGMHVAAAFGIPQIAIFGSASPVWTRPLNKNSRVVYKNLECSPCFQRTCPLNTYACLSDISPEDVISHIEELI